MPRSILGRWWGGGGAGPQPVVESAIAALAVPGEGEKPPLPPKPSPPHSFTSMITARPFRKSIAAPAVQRPCSVQSLHENNSCIQYIYINLD